MLLRDSQGRRRYRKGSRTRFRRRNSRAANAANSADRHPRSCRRQPPAEASSSRPPGEAIRQERTSRSAVEQKSRGNHRCRSTPVECAETSNGWAGISATLLASSTKLAASSRSLPLQPSVMIDGYWPQASAVAICITGAALEVGDRHAFGTSRLIPGEHDVASMQVVTRSYPWCSPGSHAPFNAADKARPGIASGYFESGARRCQLVRVDVADAQALAGPPAATDRTMSDRAWPLARLDPGQRRRHRAPVQLAAEGSASVLSPTPRPRRRCAASRSLRWWAQNVAQGTTNRGRPARLIQVSTVNRGSSKPAGRCSPPLGRFDSCAASSTLDGYAETAGRRVGG